MCLKSENLDFNLMEFDSTRDLINTLSFSLQKLTINDICIKSYSLINKDKRKRIAIQTTLSFRYKDLFSIWFDMDFIKAIEPEESIDITNLSLVNKILQTAEFIPSFGSPDVTYWENDDSLFAQIFTENEELINWLYNDANYYNERQEDPDRIKGQPYSLVTTNGAAGQIIDPFYEEIIKGGEIRESVFKQIREQLNTVLK